MLLVVYRTGHKDPHLGNTPGQGPHGQCLVSSPGSRNTELEELRTILEAVGDTRGKLKSTFGH